MLPCQSDASGQSDVKQNSVSPEKSANKKLH